MTTIDLQVKEALARLQTWINAQITTLAVDFHYDMGKLHRKRDLEIQAMVARASLRQARDYQSTLKCQLNQIKTTQWPYS